jgi:K+-sensing histidine kinase KdpD
VRKVWREAIVGGQLWTIHSRRGRLHPGQRVWVADISHNALIVANTNAALVLVLLVVAAAATGVRTAGVAAALSTALWFDFFLTQPYQHFTITAQADVETAALLVLVGIAVTEVALWGRRQQALASRKDGYLNGVMRTASLVAAGHPEPEALIAQVADQLVEVLDIDDCRFDNDTRDIAPAALMRDGTVTRHGHQVDVTRHGMPTDSEIPRRPTPRTASAGRRLGRARPRAGRTPHLPVRRSG